MSDLKSGWDAAESLKQQLAEAKAETQRILEIGKRFERDYRASFEQGCVNLQRAERAEATSKKLAAHLLAYRKYCTGHGHNLPPPDFEAADAALADYSKEAK